MSGLITAAVREQGAHGRDPYRPGDGAEGSPGSDVYRHRDSASGVVAEVRTDGVPVGLALPERLLDRRSEDVAAALLRSLVAAASGARVLLEERAEAEWEASEDADELRRFVP